MAWSDDVGYDTKTPNDLQKNVFLFFFVKKWPCDLSQSYFGMDQHYFSCGSNKFGDETETGFIREATDYTKEPLK